MPASSALRVAVVAFTATLAAAPSEAQAPPAATERDAHWTYQGPTGPAYWGQLDPDFATCTIGARQSPIDVPTTPPAPTAIAFDYRSSSAVVLNNGHTIEVSLTEAGGAVIGGKRFDIVQFHFHAPGEHTQADVPAALEMHVVHRGADQSLAVLAVLFDVGEGDNPFLSQVWAELPKAEGGRSFPALPLTVADAFDAAAPLFTYPGSLTTPPCTEGVTWVVSLGRQVLSREQLAEFVAAVGFNARPVQADNGRLGNAR